MFGMVYDQAQRGLRLNTPEAIHGSLLGYKELFLEGKMVSARDLARVGPKTWLTRSFSSS